MQGDIIDGPCHKVSPSQISPMSHCTSVPSWCMAGCSRHIDSWEVPGALQTRISSCYILQDNHIKTLCKDLPCRKYSIIILQNISNNKVWEKPCHAIRYPPAGQSYQTCSAEKVKQPVPIALLLMVHRLWG